MFSSRSNARCDLKTALTVVVFFIYIVSLHSQPVESTISGQKEKQSVWMGKMMVLGSKPPGCVHKCFNCRPCLATVVIHHLHQISDHGFTTSSSSSMYEEDDGYYLLSWKCRCGNKVYEP